MFEKFLTENNLKILNEINNGYFEGNMIYQWQEQIDKFVKDYKISQIEITEKDKTDLISEITAKQEA